MSTLGTRSVASTYNTSTESVSDHSYAHAVNKLTGVSHIGQRETPEDNGHLPVDNNITINHNHDPAVSATSVKTDSESLRRETPKYRGVYIEGKLQGIDVTYTVDTGATCTIVSDRIFEKIPAEIRPVLHKPKLEHVLSSADGKAMQFWGKAEVKLELGLLQLNHRVSVASIEDEVLLGADVLMQTGIPADILLSEGVMHLGGIAIPLKQVSSQSAVCKVTSVDDYVIPGMSEAILDVFVERNDDEHGPMLLEPYQTDERQLELLVGPTLVDPDVCCTVKIRVLNPSVDPITIHHDEVVAQAECVSSEIQVLLDQECESELDNFSSTRRIRLCKQTETTDTARTVDASQLGVSHFSIPEHLHQLFVAATENRDDVETESIRSMLVTFADTFSRDGNDLGLTHLAEHEIITESVRPIKQPPRRTPIAFQGEEQDAIMKLYAQGTIRPSTSPWASPLVLVRKKNGKVRPCVDYRRVNAVTTRDAFPIPRVQDCLDAVSGAKIFSTLDITSAYHQIPVKKEDIPKTAFCSKYGLWEFVTMPFGLCNATATFQRMLEVALQGLQWTSCLIYLDDVIIFGEDFSTHLQRLQSVLSRLTEAKLKLSPSKCYLFQQEVTFLGHVLSEQGIMPNPDNVSKIVHWPTPSNVSEVRTILGMGSYYRRFIKNYAEVVRPLTELTKKGKTFCWDEKCKQSIEQLKRVLTSPKIMAYPTDDGAYILDTDACGSSIGAVLSQIQGGEERVVAYGSKTMSKSERNYCVTDRELLAIKHFVEYYKHYLLGRRFVVRSDHQALKWLFTLKEPKDRVARWIEILSAYSFEIEYRPGVKHGNADTLSRCPNPRDCQCPISSNVTTLKCGPCGKCRKRSMDMQSQLFSYPNTTQSNNSEKCRSARVRAKTHVATYSKFTTIMLFVYACLVCTRRQLEQGGTSYHAHIGVALNEWFSVQFLRQSNESVEEVAAD